MRLFNSKALRKAENLFANPEKQLSQTLIASYSKYQILKEQQTLSKYALCSIGLTLGFIISRVPLDNRVVRLGLYGGLILSVARANSELNKYYVTRQYQDVTENILDQKEIKKLRRAYQIKRAEADEDKKALAKYKYDPQSYH
ncbi:hypothetical protein FGO68_gene16726 [Halteria grandinella]|uniref:Uncharacterized protein n=1 Tax=Halteria grandinella TaxID=5974 RepID=A0A8J8NVM2_HALGN|nr:hypothetical protein FGO68_gene16726 [Halteria grandinella]